MILELSSSELKTSQGQEPWLSYPSPAPDIVTGTEQMLSKCLTAQKVMEHWV